MNQKTRVFKNRREFLSRPDKWVNGVSARHAERYPSYQEDNASNTSCWNCTGCTRCTRCTRCTDCTRCSDCSGCTDCSHCSRCSGCKNIPSGAKSACFTGLYQYMTSPRIHADGSQHIQMGCHLRTRQEWEEDFDNNPSEFPPGSEAWKKRKFALRMNLLWLDENSTQAEEVA